MENGSKSYCWTRQGLIKIAKDCGLRWCEKKILLSEMTIMHLPASGYTYIIRAREQEYQTDVGKKCHLLRERSYTGRLGYL
jgi:hypothetical protein